MIYTEGYVPLIEITEFTLNEMLEMHLIQGDFIGPKLPEEVRTYNEWAEHAACTEGYQSIWGFLASLPHLWTFSPHLGAVMLSVRSMAVWSPEFSRGVYVDLEQGTLGSGHGLDAVAEETPETPMPEDEARRRFGAFAYCPVLISCADAKRFISQITGWEGRKPDDASAENSRIETSVSENMRQIPMRRGAPKKGGGVVEYAVRTEFLERLRSGLISSKDTTIYEAIAWAERRLGEHVSRTTMQRYLKPVFEVMDAQKSQT